MIRRTVGYGCYTDQELRLLNKLYGYLRLYVNFFQPVRKLIEKKGIGSKIIKQYDVAKTPYRRILASSDITEEVKIKLQRQYNMLNPAQMKREITRLQNKLLRLNILKKKADKDIQKEK